MWFEKQIAMKRFFLLLFLGACPAVSAQVRFADYFLEETMRFDYYHSGDSRSEEYFFDALKAEPYWAGSHVSLLDTTGYGNQFFRIVDRASEREIYSRGFCTLFNEWQSTAEADSVRRSYPESVVFPYPRRPCRIEIFGRNARGDATLLGALCREAGIRFETVPALLEDGAPEDIQKYIEAERAKKEGSNGNV